MKIRENITGKNENKKKHKRNRSELNAFLLIALSLVFIWFFYGVALAGEKGYRKSTTVVFDNSCCEEERNAVRQFLISDMSEIDYPLEIGIFPYDLNDDGNLDFFSYLQSPLHCGTSGCQLYIFLRANNGEFNKISSPTNVYQTFEISNTKHNGFYDLVFLANEENTKCFWQWDKKSYKFSMCRKGE